MVYRGWNLVFRFEIVKVGPLHATVVFYSGYSGTPVKIGIKELNKLLGIINRQTARRNMIIDISACSDIKNEFRDSDDPAIVKLKQMIGIAGY